MSSCSPQRRISVQDLLNSSLPSHPPSQSSSITDADVDVPRSPSPPPPPPPPPSAPASPPRAARGPWRREEDQLLLQLVSRYGARHWSAIARQIPRRSGKQARERWLNQLDPALKKKNWLAAEDRVILHAHRRLGNRWSAIAALLPGRTDNSVKNRFNSTLKRAMKECSAAGERLAAAGSACVEQIVSTVHAAPAASVPAASVPAASVPAAGLPAARAFGAFGSPCSVSPCTSACTLPSLPSLPCLPPPPLAQRHAPLRAQPYAYGATPWLPSLPSHGAAATAAAYNCVPHGAYVSKLPP